METEPRKLDARPVLATRRHWAGIGLIAVVLVAVSLVLTWRAYRGHEAPAGVPVQQLRSGDLTIALLSPTGTLQLGRNTYFIEFRRPDGSLVDVGSVHTSANMAMPGMVMSGGVEVSRTAVPGRYQATGEFGMAGAWKMALEWDGPAGRGSMEFEGTVR